jgi:hypothetical protein
MKKLLLLVLLCYFFIDLKGQTGIYTPNNNEISESALQSYAEGTPQQLSDEVAYAASAISSNGYNAVIEANTASFRYNCHFFAWYLSENAQTGYRYYLLPQDGGVNRFLEYDENTNPNGDNSYLKSDVYPLSADKVIIGTQATDGNHEWQGDHSMTYSKDPEDEGRDWRSKWGNGPIVRHGKYDHIYDKTTTNYHPYSYNNGDMVQYPTYFYTDIPNTPSVICSRTSQTYNIYYDNNFIISSVQELGGSKLSSVTFSVTNKTFTITPSQTGFGSCTIRITISNGSGEYDEPIDEVIDLGDDPDPVLQDPDCMCAWQSYYIGGLNHDLTFSWSFMYGSYYYYTYPYSIMVTPYMDEGYLSLTTTTTDICARQKTTIVNYPACGYCPDYFIVYPIPSNIYFQVELTREAITAIENIEAQKEELKEIDKQQLIPDLLNFKYSLIDKSGNVLLLGKGIEGCIHVDVSHVRRGIYFLIIDYGAGTESHELLIE